MTNATVLSFTGSARRLAGLLRNRRLLPVMLPLFLVSVAVWWAVVAVYYLVAVGCGVLPFLVVRRTVRRLVRRRA